MPSLEGNSLQRYRAGMEWKKAYMKKGPATLSSDSGEEFDEHDIWDALPAEPATAERDRHRSRPHQESALRRARVPTASRMMIPKSVATANDENALSISLRAKSAPMNIPDWSKLKSDSAWQLRGSQVIEEELEVAGDESDADGEEDERIPPHELIARQLARSQITSFSVCEGAGRTLKGRDVIRVRNAILTRTGFLE